MTRTVTDDTKAAELKKPQEDLGFGTKVLGKSMRLLNHDGSFNVERRGIPRYWAQNTYQLLTSVGWPLFILIVFSTYLFVNLLFSCAYIKLGIHHLAGHDGVSKMDQFWDAFFFSAQTLTTVGYGRISPHGLATSMLSAFESLVGLMGFALGTGILYARFSKPRVKVLFSKNVLLSPYLEGTGLMFRIANARKNQLIEAEIQFSVSIAKPDGTRQFYDLPLERKMIHFFALSWTIVHPIDGQSPLFGLTVEDFKNRDGEFYIQLKAFDDSFSQTVYVRNSYRFSELIYGAKFSFIFGRNENGATYIDLDRLSEYE